MAVRNSLYLQVLVYVNDAAVAIHTRQISYDDVAFWLS